MCECELHIHLNSRGHVIVRMMMMMMISLCFSLSEPVFVCGMNRELLLLLHYLTL
jgi:hypothetical protein